MEKKIVVAGHISVDITPVFQSSKKKSISQVLCPGKLIRTVKRLSTQEVSCQIQSCPS